VHLTEIRTRRPARHEELRFPQQLLDRLPGWQERRQQITVPSAGFDQVLPVGRDRVPCDWLGHVTPLAGSATVAYSCLIRVSIPGLPVLYACRDPRLCRRPAAALRTAGGSPRGGRA
jgi:hypothetical protein